MEINNYCSDDEGDILSAIEGDPAWQLFTNDDAIDNYRDALKDSVTYVCRENGEFCGYVRGISDHGLAVYISELFVVPAWRNRKIGRSLLRRVKADFANLAVYVMSDEDAYYEKTGCRKVGTLFEVLQ